MKIKGKIFVYKTIGLASVGEIGYVSVGAFKIYKNKLYINMKASYRLKISEKRPIFFERVSKDIDGFIFDFTEENFTFSPQISDPSINSAWIGPFDIKFEMFTYERFYSMSSLIELRHFWEEFHDLDDFSMMDVIVSLKNLRIQKYINKSFFEIEDMITKITANYEKLKSEKADRKDGSNVEWYNDFMVQDKNDLILFKEVLSSKLKLDLSKFNIEDLNYLLNRLDLTSESASRADFKRAGEIKKQIEILKRKNMELCHIN